MNKMSGCYLVRNSVVLALVLHGTAYAAGPTATGTSVPPAVAATPNDPATTLLVAANEAACGDSDGRYRRRRADHGRRAGNGCRQ